jgi:hypothetical protein
MTIRLIIAAFLALLFVGQAATASGVGSAFGCLTTAQALGQGRGNFGGGVGIADATSVFGTFTYGLSKYTDGRIRLGFRDDVDAELTFGADFKWQFWNIGEGRREPLDMALGGFFEYVDVGNFSVFQFGGQLFASYPFRLNRGGTLSPYGRFNTRMESYSGGGASDTELEFGLNAGVAWQATPAVAFYSEFQLDGNDGLFVGIDFNIM